MLHVGDECLDQVLHANGVLGRHHNLTVRRLSVNLVLVDGREPADPFLLLAVPVPVVALLILREVHRLGLHLRADPFVELHATWDSRSGTKRPDEAQEVDLLDLGGKSFNHLTSNLFRLCLDVLIHKAVEEAEARETKVVRHGLHNLRAVFAHEVSTVFHHLIEHLLKSADDVLVGSNLLRQSV